MLHFLKNIFTFDTNSPLLFTQFYFWAFFAIVYALFSTLQSKRLLRNSFLFFVSLFFYYKTSGLFILLLLFVTTSDFFLAKLIHTSKAEWKRKLFVITSIFIDLLLLCYLKYAYFFADVLNNIFGWDIHAFNAFSWAGNQITGTERFSVDQIILPVGISFFTFQIISYTVDVYRRKIEPVKNMLDFGFYVTFFPQLVAGPIVRASEFIPQLYKKFHLTRRQFGIAVFWILNGLSKKIILSDYIAVNFIDRVFDTPLLFTGFENLMALFGYSLQVYADFSGYTDIAIGVAMLMGFYLPQNFNSPYKATNAANFWKRWHISLSRWLQDYLYIPLGGNRNASFGTYFWIVLFSLIVLILSGSIYASLAVVGIAFIVSLVAWLNPQKRSKITTNLNAFVTMLLGGLWHGASWNFMIWGGLNGVGMIVYKFWNGMKWHWRMLWMSLTTLLFGLLCLYIPQPVFNVLFIWIAILCSATLVRYFYFLSKCTYPFARIGQIWAVLQTFTFITFTRLFFRSGSNLDPAIANEMAWSTAKNMVHQIGSTWNTNILPHIIWEYRQVFGLIVLGMIIHWLPKDFKRWYRLNIAMFPLPLLILLVIMVVFVIYQFITADLQAFIYFQF